MNGNSELIKGVFQVAATSPVASVVTSSPGQIPSTRYFIPLGWHSTRAPSFSIADVKLAATLLGLLQSSNKSRPEEISPTTNSPRLGKPILFFKSFIQAPVSSRVDSDVATGENWFRCRLCLTILATSGSSHPFSGYRGEILISLALSGPVQKEIQPRNHLERYC